jgi:hypothetical protein
MVEGVVERDTVAIVMVKGVGERNWDLLIEYGLRRRDEPNILFELNISRIHSVSIEKMISVKFFISDIFPTKNRNADILP